LKIIFKFKWKNLIQLRQVHLLLTIIKRYLFIEITEIRAKVLASGKINKGDIVRKKGF